MSRRSPAFRFPRVGSPEERFWMRVQRADADACWLWIGQLDHSGYGKYYSRHFESSAAHRISYELMIGEIPEGLVLDHLCRVRNCVNPWHLDPVTHLENIRRSPLIVKDACPKGHEYVEGSYYIDRGGRTCKECKKDSVRAHAERTGRTTASYVCEFCGETKNKTGRSRHIKKVHPEHYTPRKKSEGPTPDQKARRLEQQRIRRRAKAKRWAA